MYNVNYFINKFSAIPDNRWLSGGMGDGHGRHCAYGHCGKNGPITAEGIDLTGILSKISGMLPSHKDAIDPYLYPAARINDGDVKQYQQPTPKQRILAALYDIKKMQPVEISDPPVTVEDFIGNEIFQGQPLNG